MKRNAHILLVGEKLMLRDVIRKSMEILGVNVWEAMDGLQMFGLLKNGLVPDVIVVRVGNAVNTAMMLPEMFLKVKAICPAVRLVAMCDSPLRQSMGAEQEGGFADAVLVSPFSMDKFRGTIQEMIVE